MAWRRNPPRVKTSRFRSRAGWPDWWTTRPRISNPTWMADTTWAHQVANAVILQAPLLVYVAHPANILANPTADVVKSIPSVWDETVVLPISQIGEVAAFARRKGDTWFLAVTNGPVARVCASTCRFWARYVRGDAHSGYRRSLRCQDGAHDARWPRPALHRLAFGRRIRGEVRQITPGERGTYTRRSVHKMTVAAAAGSRLPRVYGQNATQAGGVSWRRSVAHMVAGPTAAIVFRTAGLASITVHTTSPCALAQTLKISSAKA